MHFQTSSVSFFSLRYFSFSRSPNKVGRTLKYTSGPFFSFFFFTIFSQFGIDFVQEKKKRKVKPAV